MDRISYFPSGVNPPGPFTKSRSISLSRCFSKQTSRDPRGLVSRRAPQQAAGCRWYGILQIFLDLPLSGSGKVRVVPRPPSRPATVETSLGACRTDGPLFVFYGIVPESSSRNGGLNGSRCKKSPQRRPRPAGPKPQTTS